jgi:hypothetical protein
MAPQLHETKVSDAIALYGKRREDMDTDEAIAKFTRFRLKVDKTRRPEWPEFLEYARMVYQKAERIHRQMIMDVADANDRTYSGVLGVSICRGYFLGLPALAAPAIRRASSLVSSLAESGCANLLELKGSAAASCRFNHRDSNCGGAYGTSACGRHIRLRESKQNDSSLHPK